MSAVARWFGVIAAVAVAGAIVLVLATADPTDEAAADRSPVLEAAVVDSSGIIGLGVRPLDDQSDLDALSIWLASHADIDDATLARLDTVDLSAQFVVLFAKESCRSTAWRLTVSGEAWDLHTDDELACLDDPAGSPTYRAMVFAVDEADRAAFDAPSDER